MRFPMDTLCNYHAMVSVYRGDGSVAVVHGGVEVGQGINTKVRPIAITYRKSVMKIISVYKH